MTDPDPQRALSDDDLVHLVGLVLEEDEPLPPGAVELAAGALVWRGMEGELAELLHDSALEEAVVLRDEASVRLVVFQSGDVTLDVEHGARGVAGSVSPPARYRVELQEAGPERPRSSGAHVATDEAGMFTLPGPVGGSVRFVVREAEGSMALVSPWITM